MPLQSIEFSPDYQIDYELSVHGASARFLTSMYGAFGIDLTANLQHFTYGVCDLSRIVDDCIDFPNRPTPPTFDALLAGLSMGTIKDMSELEAGRALAFVSNLTEEQLDFSREQYTDAVEVATARSSAGTIGDYAGAIQQEAAVQCAVLNISEDTIHPDSERRKLYNRWLKSFTLGAYYLDAAVDLATDYSEGRTQIRPTALARGKLLARAAPHVADTIKRMPRRTLPALGNLAITYNVPALKQRKSLNSLVEI